MPELTPNISVNPDRCKRRFASHATAGYFNRSEEPARMTSLTSDTADRSGYSIIIPEETVARSADYLEELRIGLIQAGACLRDRLQGADI